MPNNNLGLALHRLRFERGFSRLDLVEASGISSPTIQAIESNDRSPTLSTLIRLSHGLGKTPAEQKQSYLSLVEAAWEASC